MVVELPRLLSKLESAFSTEKKGGCISPLGDSYAFGIAGTGGTTSSSTIAAFSPLDFGVGSLDVEKLCDMRFDGFEARIEL